MEIFKVSLEEISLSGLEGSLLANITDLAVLFIIIIGCTLEGLWMHLSDRQPAITFSLDNPTKSYIWSQFLSSVKPAVESCPVRLYLLPKPRELTPAVQGTTPPTPSPLDYHHPFSYRFISDTSAGHTTVKGSCTTYRERKDVTMEISEEMPSLMTIVEK